MRLELGVGLSDDRSGVRASLQYKQSVHGFRVITVPPYDGRFAHTRCRFEDALDVLGKHPQTLGPGDDIFLPALDHQVTRIIEHAQVARVEPSTF